VDAFRTFLESEFPDAQITQLSDTNNVVFQVSSPEAGRIVAKHVTDTDIPLSYLARANRALADHVPVQRVLKVFETEQGDPFDATFSEFVEGQNLADQLLAGTAPSEDEIVDNLCRYVSACAHLPRLYEGFGLYKRSATPWPTHREFVEHYGRRYWNRARPFYEGTEVAEAVDRWLDGGFAAAAERHPAPYRTISADANLKNWVVEPDGRLRVLNVPIAGLSTPAHAVGAVSLHLRGSALHKKFLDTASATLCEGDAGMVPHFELWGLLGILSFYAVREPDRQAQWGKWGSDVLLDVDFRQLVESEIMPMVM
jgi:hypothetical protein